MLTADVLKLYEGNRAAVARDLGINRQAVHNWGRLVPPLSAARLERIHPDALTFDPAVYGKPRRRKPRASNCHGNQ